MSHNRGRRSGGFRDELLHHVTRAFEDPPRDRHGGRSSHSHHRRDRPRSESNHHRGREMYRPQRSYSLTPPPVDRRVHRRQYSSSSPSPSPERGGLSHYERKKLEQAAISALDAGAIAAIRSRHNPGSWMGEKGIRVATAAISAAAVDAFLDKNPGVKTKRHKLESIIGGLLVNRVMNGPPHR